MIDPAGVCFRYFGCAAGLLLYDTFESNFLFILNCSGKGAQAARTELEKIISKNDQTGGITARDAITELANIM